MKIDKILVPTDFSKGSTTALSYAVMLATEFKAKIVLLHVVSTPVDISGMHVPHFSLDKIMEEMKERAEKEMEDLLAEKSIKKTGLTFETQVREGVPFLQIIQGAKEQGADLIVMGTHGRTGLEHVFFGSTAEKVVRKAPCPVLTVRPEGQKFVMP
jgi:nucleotide-binding universal stress UspA family protein